LAEGTTIRARTVKHKPDPIALSNFMIFSTVLWLAPTVVIELSGNS
jgi:hypothetical protein